jgi:hypothetical protein
MAGRTDSARAALRRVQYMHPSLVEDAIKELDGAGLLDNGVGNGGTFHATAAPALPEREIITAMQAMAANPDNGIRIKRVVAEAARLGYEIKLNEKIDTFKMDEALKGKDVERRMTLKKNLAAMRLIP